MAMSKFDDSSIHEMQEFMATDFENVVLANGESIADYLGIYEKQPTKFKFLSGQIRLLKCLSERCMVLNQTTLGTKTYTEGTPQHTTTTPQKSSEGGLNNLV